MENENCWKPNCENISVSKYSLGWLQIHAIVYFNPNPAGVNRSCNRNNHDSEQYSLIIQQMLRSRDRDKENQGQVKDINTFK